MRWSYGITTVPERRSLLLKRTLNSLGQAGFASPRLFVDGTTSTPSWVQEFNLAVSTRHESLRIVGNWLLAFMELYLRCPNAERFALFQDDLITYRNLRTYLEEMTYPSHGYCNLYSFPSNEVVCPVIGSNGDSAPMVGWYPARRWADDPKNVQTGKGALALVFDNYAASTLLSNLGHLVSKVKNEAVGWRNLDGGIVQLMNDCGILEYVHSPSLTQHTGNASTHRRGIQLQSDSFKGEQFDALELLAMSPVIAREGP